MSGRRGFGLGSLLIGAGLVAGVWVGRSTDKRSEPVDEPSLASSRSIDELTDTVPVAPPAEEPPAPPPEAPAVEAPAVTTPLVTAVPPAPAPPPVAAPPAPPAAPAPVEPPPAVATPATPPPAPPPDPSLVSRGRVFDNDAITSSSFDEADVSEYSPVPDHEVTSSSFDDEDRVDSHPTGD